MHQLPRRLLPPWAGMPTAKALAVPLLFLLPFLIALNWGPYYEDRLYQTLQIAQNVGDGMPPVAPELARHLNPDRALLLAGLLAVAAWLGLPLPQLAAAFTSLGWAIIVVTLQRRPNAYLATSGSLIAALLLLFSPVFSNSLGLPTPWVLLLAGIAIVGNGRPRRIFIALCLLPLLHFDAGTLILVLVLAPFRLVRSARFYWLRVLLLLLVISIPAAINGWLYGRALALNVVDPREWVWLIEQRLAESPFYWWAVPMGLAGIWAIRPKSTSDRLRQRIGSEPLSRLLVIGSAWGLLAAVTDLPQGEAALTAAMVLLVGAGIKFVGQLLARRQLFRLDPPLAQVFIAAALSLPLFVAVVTTRWQQALLRPQAYARLEQEAALWLSQNTVDDASLFASARAGYLARRPTWPWEGGRGDEDQVPSLLTAFVLQSPDYVLAPRTLAWNQLVEIDWFQDRYRPARQFESAYAPASPLTIWEKRGGPYDQGERQPILVETTVGARLVGYQIWPPALRPGDTLYVTLFWQAEEAITDLFNTVVRVVSVPDGAPWAQRDWITPRSLPTSFWQPGDVIAERFALDIGTDIPVGAYEINVSLRRPRAADKDLLPMHQDGDPNEIDRVRLAYAAVPWPDNSAGAISVGAQLGQSIRLKSMSLVGELKPGETVTVTLYWEAQGQPEQDYLVFVHLVDAEGNLIANHDGPPMNGRYSTLAWQPGHTIPDEHPITLPPDLAAGQYRIQAGLYVLATGERLPAHDQDGQALPDRAVPLREFELPPAAE